MQYCRTSTPWFHDTTDFGTKSVYLRDLKHGVLHQDRFRISNGEGHTYEHQKTMVKSSVDYYKWTCLHIYLNPTPSGLHPNPVSNFQNFRTMKVLAFKQLRHDFLDVKVEIFIR